MTTISKTEIWQLSAIDMAHAIQKKEISCEETIVAHLNRIEAINPRINAISVINHKSALEAAQKADQLIATQKNVPPLLGVPITVKENIDCLGTATTFAVPALKELKPASDAPHIKLLKNAGAIVIGRTNMPDLGLRLHTDNDVHGTTFNPWDISRTPGGSSGGDAAAVATGMSALGMGNDYGGSLRQPACFCGVTAIRPSFGRIADHMSMLPSEPAITMQLFMVQGPIARHTADLLPVLKIMSRFSPRDPDWCPAPFMDWNGSGPVRVAKCIDIPGAELNASVIDGIHAAGEALADAGYSIEEAVPPGLDELWQLWIELTSSELRAFTLPHATPMISAGASQFLTNWTDLFEDCGHLGYMNGLAKRKAIFREWCRFFEKYPLILGPVVGTQPFKIDTDIASKQDFKRILSGYPLTMSANVLGLPAVAVPTGIANHLPQGVQLVAPRYHEPVCIDAAHAIEKRLGTITPALLD